MVQIFKGLFFTYDCYKFQEKNYFEKVSFWKEL